jgi:transposase
MHARTQHCTACQERDRRINDLTAQVAQLQAELANAKKNSSNSSKPPSSDIVKPPKPTPPAGGAERRKRGAQPGHPPHQRPPFEVSEIDEAIEYLLPRCPDCGGPVDPSDELPRIVQQVEVIERPIQVTEHRGMACWCPHCQTTHYAPIDKAVRRAGLVGPRLTAVIAYLKGACHCSFSTIRKFVRDVLDVTVSRGHLAKLCAKVSASLKTTYEALLALLPVQARLNVDETGHKDDGQRMWTWCFRAANFTLFKISPSRGSDVLLEVLGKEFDGVLGCDYFSAYRKYMGDCNVLVQFCLAHLIRDIKFLTTHPDLRNQAYGQRLLAAARELFAVIHRRELLSPRRFAADLEDAGRVFGGTAITRVPRTTEAQNLADRFRQHGESYLRFLTTPDVEPTNNLAEQAIRFVVLDRVVTQGTRGETGQRWLERIWTTVATCIQQGRRVFEFLQESISAHFTGQSAPALIANTS